MASTYIVTPLRTIVYESIVRLNRTPSPGQKPWTIKPVTIVRLAI